MRTISAPTILRGAILRTSLLAAGLILLFTSPTAKAQSGQSHLDRAEQAYQDIEFEEAESQAMEALREGDHDPQEMVRIFQLLGISAAAQGRDAEARAYFVRMLGLDPEAELDASVPPRLRDPFLEARGFWAAQSSRLGVEVGLDRASSSLHVTLSDPRNETARVAVHARLEGHTEYTSLEAAPAAEFRVPLPGSDQSDRVEYFVALLDRNGNRLFTLGSLTAPSVVGRQNFTSAPGVSAPSGPTIFEEPLFWIIAGSVLAAGGVTAAIVIAEQRSHIGLQSGISIGLE